jgi:hypothetical protein
MAVHVSLNQLGFELQIVERHAMSRIKT